MQSMENPLTRYPFYKINLKKYPMGYFFFYFKQICSPRTTFCVNFCIIHMNWWYIVFFIKKYAPNLAYWFPYW